MYEVSMVSGRSQKVNSELKLESPLIFKKKKSKWDKGLNKEEPLAFGEGQTFIISCFALFSFLSLRANNSLHLLWKLKHSYHSYTFPNTSRGNDTTPPIGSHGEDKKVG